MIAGLTTMTIRVTLVISLAVTAMIAVVAASAASDAPAGWSFGPEEDAVIEIGQRFDCDGADCPEDLSCLYALGPPRPPGSWWIDTEFMLDAKRMPWKDVEFWLVEKAKGLRPTLANDPLVRSDRFASSTEPKAETMPSGEYVVRRYVIAGKRQGFDLSAYLWNVKGRMSIVACLRPASGSALRTVSSQVQDLLAFLRSGEKKLVSQ